MATGTGVGDSIVEGAGVAGLQNGGILTVQGDPAATPIPSRNPSPTNPLTFSTSISNLMSTSGFFGSIITGVAGKTIRLYTVNIIQQNFSTINGNCDSETIVWLRADSGTPYYFDSHVLRGIDAWTFNYEPFGLDLVQGFGLILSTQPIFQTTKLLVIGQYQLI